MTRFAGCQLDVAARRLMRDGQPAVLEPQAFDVLAYLLDRHERVVPKEELLDAIWGGRWVSESALTTRIKEIRRAVGDTGNDQHIIRTVRGRGYQFVAALERDMSSATSLIGRDRDVTSLSERIKPGSITTLVGPGGVGKTTIARSLGSQLQGRFRDGCLTIDLTVVRSRDELSAVIAHAAQLAEATRANLPEVLSGLDVLLVLDDADELVDEVGALCSSLQRSASGGAVLVTCRERLGVNGEQIWPVLPLAEADAVALITARAQALAPLGSLIEAGASELAALAASVDYLPLAIEMLASASAYLGRDDLAELVTTHPELLTDPRRDGPTRHRSLDALVADSLARLTDRQRRALETVSVFAGSFDLTDALALSAAGPDGLSVVRKLVDRSLIAPSIAGSGGPRFQLLRTVSRAVQRTSDARTLDALRRAHATWVARELERADGELRSEGEATAANRFSELADDARLAHSWAREHDIELALSMTAAVQLYAHSRLWPEPAAWAQAIPEWRSHGRAVAAVAAQASLEGQFDLAWQLSLLILNDVEVRVRAWAREIGSDVGIYLGRLDQAQTWADELIQLGVDAQDTRMLVLGTTNGALARMYAARADDALTHLDEYPRGGPPSSAPTDIAWLAFSRGEALMIDARLDEARIHLQLAIDAGNAVGSRFVSAVAQSSLAGVQFADGDLVQSARTYRDLVDTFRRHGILTHLRITLRNVVPLAAALGSERAALTVAAWLTGTKQPVGYGPDLDAMLRITDALRERLGADVARETEAVAHGMTVTDVTAFTIATLDAAIGAATQSVE